AAPGIAVRRCDESAPFPLRRTRIGKLYSTRGGSAIYRYFEPIPSRNRCRRVWRPAAGVDACPTHYLILRMSTKAFSRTASEGLATTTSPAERPETTSISE